MPLAAAIPAIIGGVSSLAGGLVKSGAAGSAARAAVGAATDAGNYAKNNLNQAQSFITSQQNQQKANLQPYLDTGSTAANSLAQYLKNPGQGLLSTFDEKFQAPTDVTEQNDPGYQFRLNEGQKLLERGAAARGNLLTGGTAKAEQQYGQNFASQEYGNVYDRAMQQYANRFNIFNTNQGNIYSRLSGTAGMGLNAGASLNSAMGQNTALNTNALLDTSRLVGGYTEDAGAAQGAVDLAQGNALAGMVNGVGTAAASLPWSKWLPQSAPVDYGRPNVSSGTNSLNGINWGAIAQPPPNVRTSMYGN